VENLGTLARLAVARALKAQQEKLDRETHDFWTTVYNSVMANAETGATSTILEWPKNWSANMKDFIKQRCRTQHIQLNHINAYSFRLVWDGNLDD
jgi:hypothetical protein